MITYTFFENFNFELEQFFYKINILYIYHYILLFKFIILKTYLSLKNFIHI